MDPDGKKVSIEGTSSEGARFTIPPNVRHSRFSFDTSL